MPNTFKPQYVILCDDLREEVTGKVTIIGAYHEAILLDSVPEKFAIPIAFYIYGHVSGDNDTKIEAWIENPDGSRGAKVQWEQVKGAVAGPSEPAILMWKLSPWRAAGKGRYKLKLKQDGRTRTVYEYDVGVRPA